MVIIKFSEETLKIVEQLKLKSITSKKERIILKSLVNKLAILLTNPHYGNPINKKLIPDYYQIKHSAENLFRIELALFWRMIYTLSDEENKIEILLIVLDIVDHPDYDKRFGYKKR
jgi:hypothetical protein